MDRFDDVIGRGRGSDRPEPGVIGQLQQWLNTHEPAGYWWEREARRLTHGWGMTVGTISADLVQVWHGLERVTLAPGTDGHWREVVTRQRPAGERAVHGAGELASAGCGVHARNDEGRPQAPFSPVRQLGAAALWTRRVAASTP